LFEALLSVVLRAIVNDEKCPVKVREVFSGKSMDVLLEAAEKAVNAISLVECGHDDKCVYY
jgi:uncharacterized protein (UPF0147 family)